MEPGEGTSEVVLEARGLVKDYARARAVDGVDLLVHSGERVALLGPNGAGKTTTLLMVLGVISPDAGWVEISGRRLAQDRSRAAEEIGFAAGYLPLAERVRVREYLKLYGQLYGLRDPRPEIAAGLERFGIPHLADAMGTELSSGQRTLVGIVRATLHHPRLLVLDEPTASLDPDVALRVRTGLRELSDEEGTALLVTSHDMAEVGRLCDRVVFVAAGRIVANGSPDDVAATYGHGDLESVFLHLAAERQATQSHASPVTDPDGGTVMVSATLGTSWLRIRAIAHRHAYVLVRSPHRLFDVTLWPLVDVLLFGSIATFANSGQASTGAKAASYLLAGIVLWHVVYQSQIAVSTGFLEETWSRNLLNLMVTPIREWEYVAGVALFGMLKLAIGIGVMVVGALFFFSFDASTLGFGIVPIAAVLLLVGWSISLLVIGIVLRWGSGAEALAWGVMFVVMPLSGIFYPVSALPTFLQPVALALPTTHAFAALRTLVDGGGLDWPQLGIATVSAVILAALSLWFLVRMLSLFRRRGYVTRYS